MKHAANVPSSEGFLRLEYAAVADQGGGKGEDGIYEVGARGCWCRDGG